MAEFSSEFLTISKWGMEPDFSILSIYQKLKDGEEVQRICEGFGITKIMRKNNICFVYVLSKSDYLIFDEIVNSLKDSYDLKQQN